MKTTKQTTTNKYFIIQFGGFKNEYEYFQKSFSFEKTFLQAACAVIFCSVVSLGISQRCPQNNRKLIVTFVLLAFDVSLRLKMHRDTSQTVPA